MPMANCFVDALVRLGYPTVIGMHGKSEILDAPLTFASLGLVSESEILFIFLLQKDCKIDICLIQYKKEC